MALPGNEVMLGSDGSVEVINDTAIPDADVWDALREQNQPFFQAIASWVTGNRPRGSGGILARDRFIAPGNIVDQMKVAQAAVQNDDVVAGVLESTESLALSRMSIECWDESEENIWNQIASDLDLDSRLREMWRELFTVSQFYAVTWWGTKSYKVKGRDPKTGVKRKKPFNNLRVPLAITLLDPLKVVPVGNLMFNQETLVYMADRGEGKAIADTMENRSNDEVIQRLMVGKYEPDQKERKLLADMGFTTDSMWELNPAYVWRHTATRPQYQRFADVRLKSVFETLDLKVQLREMDRATLLGATNFIVLIKIGDKDKPGKQDEIDRMQAGVRMLARVPIIVGDHRLAIEIITPSTDKTLEPERYNLLNGQLAARLYQTFITNGSSTKDDSLKLARVIARGLESRRHMLRRAVEKNILMPTFERNEQLTEEPTLEFHPHQVALDFDANLAAYYLDLRDRGDVSRQTMLNQVDLDQDQEYKNRKREKDNGYDDVFETQVPFSAPQNTGTSTDNTNGGGGSKNPRSAGRTQGGNRNGGGAAPGSGQGQAPRNPRKRSK